ncbi:MAG TPA: PAS domain S-box protein, partial [Candidatus Bathyarchaeia archaeon]
MHVDDDFSFLEVSKQILEDMGNFVIDTACSVDEGLKKMETIHYDAVISDYEMPAKNGLQFLQELREQKKDIPFVLFTGKGREDVAIKALNLGSDRYVNKQCNPETVYGELSDALVKTIEHKQSKRLHAESESKYRKLVENSLQGIAIISGPSPRFVFVNSAMEELFGYSKEEMINFSPEQIAKKVHPDDRESFFNRFRMRIEGKQVETNYVFRGFRKDGTLRWVEVCANLICYDGQPAVQAEFLDITEIKKAEEILHESEQRYRELANSLPDIIFESDVTGKVEFVNERGLEIAGISNSDLEKGLNILQFLVPGDRERAMKNMKRLLAGGIYVPAEYTFLRKDGTIFPALITTTIRKSENKVVGFRGRVIDITESKQSQISLLQSEEQFKQLFASMPSGVAIYEAVDNGEDFVFKDYNAAAEKIEKINKDDVIGKRVTQVFPNVKTFGIFEVFQRVWCTGSSEYYPASFYKDDKGS